MGLVLTAMRQVGQDAAKLAAADLWPVPEHQIADLLRAAHRLEQAALVMQARLVREADALGQPAAQGYRATHSWVRDRHQTRAAATASASSGSSSMNVTYDEVAPFDRTGHSKAGRSRISAANEAADPSRPLTAPDCPGSARPVPSRGPGPESPDAPIMLASLPAPNRGR
ncbi:hypothetical protein [Actinoplanes solisilvae]|uniref:hypothetical protein n=1 Tax=Actinoplanes solisilvae TaxID=2486853 RepID=UPI000FD7C06E|nr:hypothetical protein [Actinoplanes solisilvae]